MPIPVWAVGQVLSASDVNSWFVPVAAFKAADTARSSTTTMTNDPDIVLPLAASATYYVHGVLFYTGAAMSAFNDPGGFKFTFNVPGSATGHYNPIRDNVSDQFAGTFADTWTVTENARTSGINTTTDLRVLTIMGLIATAGSGNFQLQWAQNVSSGTATTLRADSVLLAQRVA